MADLNVDAFSEALNDKVDIGFGNCPHKPLTDENITNCITKIPQDIKVDLSSDGTLTIKAGSKVYYADGTSRVLTEDVSNTSVLGFAYAYLTDGSRYFDYKDLNGVFIQDTAPTTYQYMYWYDTANKQCFSTSDYGATWTRASLPFCCFSGDGAKITYVNQVFNGFGYFNNAAFILPGVEALMADGFNDDGSLKNYHYIQQDVYVAVRTWTVTATTETGIIQYLFLGKDETHKLWYFNTYTEGNSPALTEYDIWYNPRTNITKVNRANTAPTIDQYAKVVGCKVSFPLDTTYQAAPAKITYFKTKTPFIALDRNDSDIITEWSFPSTRYINLTLGESGSKYKAPGNGWFTILKTAGVANGIVRMVNTTAGYLCDSTATFATSTVAAVNIPASKGDVVSVNHNLTGTNYNYFRFVYAKGQKQ